MLTPFSQIIAQDQAKEMLRRALTGGRLAHAYLFRGPAGVGKKTAARALAAAVNCRASDHRAPPTAAIKPAHEGTVLKTLPDHTSPSRLPQAAVPGERSPGTAPSDPLEACGRCPSCRKFASRNHPDFMEILPEGAGIKISQVRELKKGLHFPPLEAGLRVVMLGEVHTMRREAANSLLKTLEEPPADTILILTGDEAGGILPTILSRCQIVPFYPLNVDTLAMELARRGGLDPERAATLAAVAEGSMGRARQLWQKNLLELRRQVLHMLLHHDPEEPAAVAAVLYWAEKCAQLKEDLEDFLDLLASCYHDLTVLNTLTRTTIDNRTRVAPLSAACPPPRLTINQDLLPLLTKAAAQRDFPHLDRCRQHFRRAKGRLNRNCNRTLVCEVLFFDLL